ncbi:hypothetical protein B0H15DRAFT_797691 [Mycena belliarum]|uniref:Uncharacterized protein n=1 Tax=Mycena belliarum TaxID=1033014 RepID=A0AAD6UGR9_9AGAR|nr:hypothetical protein B0H15DRAFT_797691 [Mycena belliae]
MIPLAPLARGQTRFVQIANHNWRRERAALAVRIWSCRLKGQGGPGAEARRRACSTRVLVCSGDDQRAGRYTVDAGGRRTGSEDGGRRRARDCVGATVSTNHGRVGHEALATAGGGWAVRVGRKWWGGDMSVGAQAAGSTGAQEVAAKLCGMVIGLGGGNTRHRCGCAPSDNIEDAPATCLSGTIEADVVLGSKADCRHRQVLVLLSGAATGTCPKQAATRSGDAHLCWSCAKQVDVPLAHSDL